MSLQVEALEGRRDQARFIDVPWHIYDPSEHPAWVPPLRVQVADLLDTRRNPFYRNADIQLFLARDGDRLLGRIAAVENRWHNEAHEDRVGFFGFFESVDDASVAAGLLAAAEEWLAARGLEASRGPANPSMNHECGLLVDGYDEHPVLATTWNPPYYLDLLEGAGYAKARDLLAYWMPTGKDTEVPERVARLSERMRKRAGLTFRDGDFGRGFKEDVRKVWEIYREAWAGNWGFVPPEWDEFWHTSRSLKLVLSRDFSFIAEVEGEPVGFMLVAHDLNRVLKTIPSGRLWPWHLLKVLFRTRKVLSGRMLLVGIKPERRFRNLLPIFVHEAMRRGRAMNAVGAEASWILEDNEAAQAPLDSLGFAPYRRWRILERALPSQSG